jgi:hypothetical protein
MGMASQMDLKDDQEKEMKRKKVRLAKQAARDSEL